MHLLLVFLFFFPSYCSEIYLNPNSNCSSCNGSVSFPFPTFSAAISYIGSSAAEFILMDGTYYVQNLTLSSRNITIKSMNGAKFAIIDGNNTSNCLNLNLGTFIFNGITIQNCIKINQTSSNNINISRNNSGGAFWIQSSNVILSNLIILNNRADYAGGGISIVSGSLFLYNCTIINNKATFGGGIYSQNVYFLISNSSKISDNVASYLGGGIFLVSGSFEFKNSSKLANNQLSSNSSQNQVSCFQASGSFYNQSTFDEGFFCDRCSVIDKTEVYEVNICDSNFNSFKIIIKLAWMIIIPIISLVFVV